jgi:hypothetical protein
MVVCSSDDLIHALTCSYSMHQIEEERQDDPSGLDSNQEALIDDHDRQEQQQRPRTSNSISSIYPAVLQLRPTIDLSSETYKNVSILKEKQCDATNTNNSPARTSRTTRRINKHYKNDYHHHYRENQRHYRNPILINSSTNHSSARRFMPQTILEDASLEDLVLESKDWLLKSLLDLDESKSGDP